MRLALTQMHGLIPEPCFWKSCLPGDGSEVGQIKQMKM